MPRRCWVTSRAPTHGIVHIGPLPLHAYGLMLAIGVLVAAKIADVRWRRTGHDPKVIAEIAVPVVIGGVDRRARLPPVHRLQVERRRHRRRVRDLEGRTVDLGRGRGRPDRGRRSSRAGATSTRSRCWTRSRPASCVAQAIGRWGNYFNQELFGRPTHAAVGARDRPRAPAGRLRAVRDVPPDVPLRVALVPARVRHDRVARAHVAACARGRRSRSTSRCTRSVASSSSGCASTPRRRSSASASTCCSRPCCASVGIVWFVLARPPDR